MWIDNHLKIKYVIETLMGDEYNSAQSFISQWAYIMEGECPGFWLLGISKLFQN